MDPALTAAAIGVGGTVIVGVAGFWANVRNTNKITKLTEQGQLTDRYSKAVEQLGSDKLDVRIGGIYALERIAHDSPRDHPTVMEVLAAFVRENSREPLRPSSRAESGDDRPEPWIRPDVQAAVTVIGRRNPEHDSQPVDLRLANLGGADLAGADLRGVILGGADLRDANLRGADLRGADLWTADLRGAYLRGVNLHGADLRGTKFHDAFWSPLEAVPEGWQLGEELPGGDEKLSRLQPVPKSGGDS
jgi:hypothetical protein